MDRQYGADCSQLLYMTGTSSYCHYYHLVHCLRNHKLSFADIIVSMVRLRHRLPKSGSQQNGKAVLPYYPRLISAAYIPLNIDDAEIGPLVLTSREMYTIVS